jgi:predicted nucleic-acid-binding Zn-ribbon protein
MRRRGVRGLVTRRRGKRGKIGVGTRRTNVKAGLMSVLSGNKDITSKDGKYMHAGTKDVLKCFQCGGDTWMVNSFAFGGRVADAFDVDWATDKTYYAYTCENCSELRLKKVALLRGDRV